MKIATMIFGTLGILFCAALAVVWLGDAAERSADIATLRAMGAAGEIDAIINAGYALIAAAIMGVVGMVFSWKGQAKIASPLFGLALVLPAIFTAKTFLVTFPFGLAALMVWKARAPSTGRGAPLAPATSS